MALSLQAYSCFLFSNLFILAANSQKISKLILFMNIHTYCGIKQEHSIQILQFGKLILNENLQKSKPLQRTSNVRKMLFDEKARNQKSCDTVALTFRASGWLEFIYRGNFYKAPLNPSQCISYLYIGTMNCKEGEYCVQ